MTEPTVQLVPTGAPELVPAEPTPVTAAMADQPKKDKDKKKKKKKERSRGIETMFRVTYSNHIALSRLADSKISMLIAANGGIISLVITLVAKTATVSWHFAPVLVLLAGCLVSLVFTVAAARPRVRRSHVDVDDIRNNTGNLLFFAQFTSMSLPQFQEAVHVLMKEPELLYDHLARQLYHMGESLNRKYRYLQIAYSAFLSGLGVATVLFAFLYLTGGLDAVRL
jgi:pycsar effector protein